MISGSRTKRASWWWLLGWMLAMSAFGAGVRSADEEARAQFPQTDRIAEGRVVYVQQRNRPDLDKDPVAHVLVVSVDRTITGPRLSGEVLMTVWVLMPRAGVVTRGKRIYDCTLAPPEKYDPATCGKPTSILSLDPKFWREGARIRFADWQRWDRTDWKSCPDSRRSQDGRRHDPRKPAGDEQLVRWMDAPQIAVDINHIVKLDDGEPVASLDPPEREADALVPGDH